MEENKLQKAQEEYLSLISKQKSVVISSLDKEGKPYISFAPFAIDKDYNFYILISEMSEHFFNLSKNSDASIFLAEDENETSNIYARVRLNFSIIAKNLKEDHDLAYKLLHERFGNMVEHLKNIDDFHFFKLVPQKGRFIIGFGQAFDLLQDDLSQLVHVKGGKGGMGHRMKK
ncbi:MAG: pyridoxamine 5-phosphate oxidase [Candidatus Cloacimonadota bacterium]|nr:MAG: pyridoxamine 5-phosphate oxidase [Candidatus Cloacimonadota bacterium]